MHILFEIKTSHITEYVQEHDVDMLFITETWLSEADDVVIGECTPPGYTFISSPRISSTRGGGIGVLFKTPLKLKKKNKDFVSSTFEYIHKWVQNK